MDILWLSWRETLCEDVEEEFQEEVEHNWKETFGSQKPRKTVVALLFVILQFLWIWRHGEGVGVHKAKKLESWKFYRQKLGRQKLIKLC